MLKPDLDIHLGSPVLPERIKRVRTDHRGALTFYVDTEDHDLDLLANIAEGVAQHPELLDALKRYAGVIERINTAEINEEPYPLRRSLEDERVDVLADVESFLPDGGIGEGMTTGLRPEASVCLVAALAAREEVAV